MSQSNPMQPSPPWGTNTKLVVGLTVVAIVAIFFVRFQALLGPLILAFTLTYLLHPLVAALSKSTHLSWRMSVNLVFVILLIVLIGLFTLSGFALLQQFQSLIRVVQNFVNELPEMIADLSDRVYVLGPYTLDMSLYLDEANLQGVVQELLGVVQPLLGQAGGLIATLASGTATMIGWGFFVLVTSYFLLADMSRVSNRILDVELPPGIHADFRHLGRELAHIWNAFLRGQVILFTLASIVFLMAFSALGVRYVLALALLAGLSRFVPYIGPVFTWTITMLVVFFQPENYLGLANWQYALLVLGVALLIDQIFDNMISPRVLGRSVGVRPAAVLVAAVIAANMIGLIGIVLAAPAVASLTLIARYTLSKMFDLDPWPDPGAEPEPVPYPWQGWGPRLQRARAWLRNHWGRRGR
jgi:predicted PurR-regulated permease PerM